MNNEHILNILEQMASLMELHAENEFKIKGYAMAAYTLDKSTVELSKLSQAELEKLPNIGKSIAASIFEITQTGKLAALEKLLEETPEGVVDMLGIKGIGPKKIRTIWKELGIESLEALMQACENNEVAKLKGFGEKTQDNIIQNIQFKLAQKGKLRYAKAQKIADAWMELIKTQIPDVLISESGAMRRRMDVADKLELVIGHNQFDEVIEVLSQIEEAEYYPQQSGPFTWRGRHKESETPIEIRLCKKDDFTKVLMLKTGSAIHLNKIQKDGNTLSTLLKTGSIKSEEEAYALLDKPFIAPELREGLLELQFGPENQPPKLVEMSDLKGILHNHSTYSDGKNTLREMAEYCKELGYQYLGISDHSQTAVYANGLDVNRVKKQQEEIDQLNKELAPFKIFKGIESDILNDGKLDYPDEVLASFDFIVASIHSNLKMDEKKATERLLKAISNPYTTMLGHPTGRLILQREGYPIDHKAIIDACAEHGVIIEINASPYRLDLDWHWVNYAMEKGVMLSINPDAHEKAGYHDMYYGLLSGRKGGLTKEMTFNALTVVEVDTHFKKRLLTLSSK